MGSVEQSPLTVEEAGVTVAKALDTDTFEHPAVEIAIESNCEVPLRVALTDPLPADLPIEYIEFHPECEANSGRSREGCSGSSGSSGRVKR